MPVYEYICNSCGKKFSTFVSSFSTPDNEVRCKYCQSQNSERLLSMKSSIAASSSPDGSKGCSAPAGSSFG